MVPWYEVITRLTTLADLRGHQGCRPALAQNFLIFMWFSGKNGQIVYWRPLLGTPGSATGQDKTPQEERAVDSIL